MQIILVTQRHGRSLHLPTWLGRSMPYLILVSAVGLFYLGFLAGTPEAGRALSDRALVQWEQEIHSQRQLLDQITRQSEEELAALAVRLAELQARSTRLDALGERLIDVAGLEDSEFDFSMPPGVGGPEVPVSSDDDQRFQRPPTFAEELERLEAHLDSRRQQLTVLESLLNNRSMDDQTFVAGRPVGSGAWMSSRYGYRTDPFTGANAWHGGLDFAGPEGLDIVSVASGVVVYSGERGGYGNMVEINHGGGYSTRYAHNRENYVQVGEIVEKGQVIAALGNTGRSTAPHVHFEVHNNGRTRDPIDYISRTRN
ncbi:M23 family metallopeptidase [Natronospirillum operosum]|uniref:M23 family metallopeptidase n=1 Tax=Natronospirillum operosum TaxID=2759953 RepID=A0A4Z0W516_9GAMM|nr:M23 family metallopeptidase [Natronospirillum operosum]TGG92732.1 M23 family metallopeptidase [Natronospirillum operosum]